MFSLRTIHLPLDGGGVRVIEKRKAFEATPDQAKQLDGLKAARPATADEVKAAKDQAVKADGSAFTVAAAAPTAPVPDASATPPASGAKGDPAAVPKSA
ncbi:MAG: hypothetical protein P4M09_21975 [Devosia sp.]|nr:hypothetical protein [Devosia sp.]